jgi:hypothetical protein
MNARSLPALRRRLRRLRLWRAEGGQALVEFAVVLPVQLFVVFGIMQLALLFVSTLAVNYTAYRCARIGLVGEDAETGNRFVIVHDGETHEGDTYTAEDAAAAMLLAPLAGSTLPEMSARPPRAEIPGWGPVAGSDIAAVKSRVVISRSDPDSGEPPTVTATVEWNQELVFPFVDSLFRLVVGRDRPVEDEFAFGTADADFISLQYGEINTPDSGRGKIRVINNATHYVITRSWTLSAETGWAPES